MQQQSNNSMGDDCVAVDEFIVNQVLQKFISCKADDNDLNDIAESLTKVLSSEFINGNITSDVQPPPVTDWHLCERLQPELGADDQAQYCFLTAGYTDCMDEAIRFLVEEEDMTPEHPLVRNLKAHLEQSRDRVLSAACDTDIDNNNVNRTPCVSQTDSYDCYPSLNILSTAMLSNTG